MDKSQLMPRLSAKVFQNREVNIVPQSDTIESESPCKRMMFLMNSLANCGAVVILVQGIKCNIFIN